MYKRVRTVIQNGLLYRLRSPRAGRVAATQYVAQGGSEVVVFAWGHSQQFGETQVALPLHGLEEEAHYADVMSSPTYSGEYLAQKGLLLNMVGDFDSRMVHLFALRQLGKRAVPARAMCVVYGWAPRPRTLSITERKGIRGELCKPKLL